MDELGPGDRVWIDEAIAARSPSAADRARVREKLIAAGVLGAMTGAAAGTAQASAALSATKVVSMLAVVGVVTGAVVWGASETSRVAAPRTVGVEQTAPDAVATEATATEATDDTGTGETAVEATVAPDRSDDTAEPAGEPAVRTRRARPSSPRAISLADDVALLHRAQAERARDPARALALALEHRQRFPRSPLAEERTALRVLLLCDLGRQAAAERLAGRFLARAEDSPLRRSVEESCIRR